MSNEQSKISEAAREAANLEMRDQSDWIPGHERPTPVGYHVQRALTAKDAEIAAKEQARYYEEGRCEHLTSELRALRSELAAVKESRQSEIDALTDGLRKERARAELADDYETWLDNIGQVIGCGHVNEALVTCVRQTFEDLENKLATERTAREAAEKAFNNAFAELKTRTAERDAALAQLSEARKDSERLEWLDKQKKEHAAGWASGCCGEPAWWRNPSVSWRIKQSEADGTYEMPTGLKDLTLRVAIDRARESV